MLLWRRRIQYGKGGAEHCMKSRLEELEGANSVSVEEEDGVLEHYTEREEYRLQKKEKLYDTVAEQE